MPSLAPARPTTGRTGELGNAEWGMRKRVYLSLGSNLGDRKAHLEQVLEEMRAAGLEVQRVSSFYETQPVDFPRQDWFLNCAVEVETEMMPRQLLRKLQRIERRLGRRRLAKRGPRTVDIDILLYENSVIKTAELTVPHPRLAERRFVLEALREIAADARHPVSRKTVGEMLNAVRDTSRVQRVRG